MTTGKRITACRPYPEGTDTLIAYWPWEFNNFFNHRIDGSTREINIGQLIPQILIKAPEKKPGNQNKEIILP